MYMRKKNLGGAIKKKTTKFWTSSKHGGVVSCAAKPFIEKRYGHVLRGGGGSKGHVQSSFL